MDNIFYFNINYLSDIADNPVDNSEASTEEASEGVSENVSTEITTETSTVPEESIVTEGYDYQYSDIEFLAPYDDETSEYVPIVFDNRPYMSSEVSGATINDVYTMVLSIRNIVMLWFLLWLLLKFKTMIHNVVMKYMEGGR